MFLLEILEIGYGNAKNADYDLIRAQSETAGITIADLSVREEE